MPRCIAGSMSDPLPINQVLHGDSREVLKTLPDACVDSVVTDPPAGISFMSKKWDDPDAWKEDLPDEDEESPTESTPTSDKRLADRNAFIGFLREIMKEAFRVLKPGGFALVWSIPRTSHWTATALEEAGFETRDCIYHVFGCLSEDTEILTERGWEPYHTLEESRLAMCYDVENGSFQWQPIQQVFTYPYKDTAYRIHGDHTDQLVSRNHRCLVERSGATVFEYAEALQCQENVPVLEDVSALLEALPLPNTGASNSQSNVFSTMCVREHGSQEQRSQDSSCRMQDVRGRVQTQEQRLDNEGRILRVQMPGCSQDVRSCTESTSQGHRQARTPGVDTGFSDDLPQEDVGGRQSCLEGRGDLLLEARELRFGKIRSVSARVPLDVPQGRVRRGAQTHRGQGALQTVDSVGDGASYQSRSHRQPGIEFGSIPNEQRSQVVRASRFTTSDLVRVDPVPYEGIVWCVRVPSGSFVARRSGKAFVTGNSGFPKSLNVAKALAKMGREEDAKKFEGWGTSLKPAVEPWWLVRKPIDEATIAAQMLATSTGGINIDGTRVVYAGSTDKASALPGSAEKPADNQNPKGRWPANLVLSHNSDCRMVGKKIVAAPVINRFDDGMKPFGDGAGHAYTSSGGGTEEQPVHECSPGCPVAILNGQSGDTTSGAMKHEVPGYEGDSSTAFIRGRSGPSNQHGGSGGAGRFFNTFEPEYEVPFFYTGKASKKDRNADLEGMPERAQHLMSEQTVSTASNRKCRICNRVKFGQPHCECETPEWEETEGSKSANHHPTVKSQALMRHLVRLTTPKGGIVLDPFAGSGSTLVAAASEGMTFIGIEKEADYLVIAQTRCAAMVQREESKKNQEDIFSFFMSGDDD